MGETGIFITTEEMLELEKQEEEEKRKTSGSYYAGDIPKKEPVKEVQSGGGGTAGAIKEPKFITTAEMLELEKKDVPEQSTFDYLNTSIEKNYKTAMKLEKELTEFDTSMEGIPEEFKPSFVSNYNKKLTDFNTLVSGIKDDISKRDEIIKNKNMQIFIKNKQLGFNQPQGEVMPEPTWGEVIKHRLTAGTAGFQASLVNLFRLVDMGVTKLTDPINKLIPIDDEKMKAFEEKYGEKPNLNTTDMLTKIVEESESIESMNRQQAESKNWLKKLIGTGLEAMPQIVGSTVLGAGMPLLGELSSTKPLYEITNRVIQMIPFGVSSGAGHARNFEKEFEALDKEAPYLSMVLAGVLGGAGETATELPIFMGLASLVKGGMKGIVNEGAKTLVGKYGKAGIEVIKDMALQPWQEAEMVSIEKAIKEALGLPQDWSFKPMIKEMGEAAYGGFAMFLVTFGLGGAVGGSAMVANKTLQKVDDFMQNKDDIRGTLLKIAQLQGVLPEGGEEVALAYQEELSEEERKAYAKKYDIPLEKVPKTKEVLDKADVTSETVSEETINKIEERFGTKATPESVLKKVKESVSQEKQTTEQKAVEPITEKAITKEEEAEPTPEEIRETFKGDYLKTTEKNKELFYSKYDEVYSKTKESSEKLINEKIAELKEESGKGVERGGLKKDEEGYVQGVIPTISNNPKWYRDFYERNKKAPTNEDLRNIAIDQLSKGYTEDYGEVPANQNFNKLEAQIESYETMLADIKEGDYSFAKDPNKLNKKLEEMKNSNKQITSEHAKVTKELESLKEGLKDKYIELRKEAYAREEEEIKKGIERGVAKEKVKLNEEEEINKFFKAEEEYPGKIIKEEKRDIKQVKIKDIPKDEMKTGNNLIRDIQVMIKKKGLTDTQVSDIKMKVGGARHLSGKTYRMSLPKLQAVLKAIEKARPNQVGYKKVVTLKTENKIVLKR